MKENKKKNNYSSPKVITSSSYILSRSTAACTISVQAYCSLALRGWVGAMRNVLVVGKSIYSPVTVS